MALRAVASDIISSTWANKPSSAASTGLYLFTDVGSSGTLMRYANSRWRPLAGQAQLASLGASVSGITNSETIVLQTLIPAGAWQTNDTIRIWLTGTKSGTTNTSNLSVRIGTAGTTADTVITGLSAFQFITAANILSGGIYDIKLISATSAQKVGNNAAGASTYQGVTTAGAASATVISDASANALYVSVTLASSGAVDTVAIQSGQIQLVTP